MAAAAYGATDAGLKAKLLDGGGVEPANGGGASGGGSAPHVHSQEESAAYLALRRAGLLTTQHRRSGIEGLDILAPNTNSQWVSAARAAAPGGWRGLTRDPGLGAQTPGGF